MAIDISTSLGTTNSPDKAEVELLSMIGSIAAFSILSLALNPSPRARDLLVRAAIRIQTQGKHVVSYLCELNPFYFNSTHLLESMVVLQEI